MGRTPLYFYELRGKRVPISEIVKETGESIYKIKKRLGEGERIEDIADGTNKGRKIQEEKEALSECTGSQLGLIGNFKNGIIDFGLSAFFKIAEMVEKEGLIKKLFLKDSCGASFKYFMPPKEFKYLKEQLSIEIASEYFYERRKLLFRIHSVNFEVQRVSLSTAKKLEKSERQYEFSRTQAGN